MDERTAWIALAAVTGIGDVLFARLVAEHGGAAAALRAVAGGAPILTEDGRRVGRAVREGVMVAARDPTAIHRQLTELGLWTRTPLDAEYPSRLAVLDPPPLVIYGWGDASALDATRSIAVVGTRRPTLAGRDFTTRIVRRLVEAGAVVVSGLAIGIDGAAHSAALEAAGRTVAVIGGGHRRPGPTAHRALVRRIRDEGGAVVSELPPDATPSRGTFPRRNRIVSALGDATIVVEAPARSGALITARHALEQGRPVLAMPGRPGDRSVAGCLALLRDTPARPLIGLDEMIADLGWSGSSEIAGTSPSLTLDAALALVGPAERAVAHRLSAGPVSDDTLVADTGLPPAVVSGALTLLLLRGWAHVLGPAYLPAGPLLASGSRPLDTADHR